MTRQLTLLDYFRSLNGQRQIWSSIIGAHEDSACVYYVVSLTNLRLIRQSGGIRSRSDVKNFSDASGHAIQHLREKEIFLINSDGEKIKRPVHQCVNFFLNPFNDTFFHFRRNTVLNTAFESNFSPLTCILEIDLEGLLRLPGIYWAVTDKNIAVGNARVCLNQDSYRTLEWSAIYSIRPSRVRDALNEFRSAELIVHMDKPLEQRMVPFDLVRRICILDSDYQKFTHGQTLPSQPVVHRIKGSSNYAVFDNPLYSDIRLVNTLLELSRILGSLDSFSQALTILRNAEENTGINIAESSASKSVAVGSIHGALHTSRVAFLALFLALISDHFGFSVKPEDIETTLFAALIHDLARENNAEEPTHGARAAHRFESYLRSCLKPDQVGSCLLAVTWHSRDQDPDSPDIVCQLLKDADALDRGRFGPPSSPVGCNISRLRLAVLKSNKKLASECIWLAYWLAQSTRFVNWENQVCPELVYSIMKSIKAVINYGQLPPGDKTNLLMIVEQLAKKD
jgi:hypothetical protein